MNKAGRQTIMFLWADLTAKSPKHLIFLLGSFCLAVTPAAKAAPNGAIVWLRMTEQPKAMKLNRLNDYVAFLGGLNNRLKLLHLPSKQIYQVTTGPVSKDFFWSPYGQRLVFRELSADKDGLDSALKIHDISTKQTKLVESLPSASGYLTFDPYDQRLRVLTTEGVLVRKFSFPDQRLARWQQTQRAYQGRYLFSRRHTYWLTYGGNSMTKVTEADEPIYGTVLSPDGHAAAWFDKSEKVWVSIDGSVAQFVGYGRDPSWHPAKKQLVYAAARRLGKKTIGYDLRLADVALGVQRFITKTLDDPERSPQFMRNGLALIFTVEGRTEIYWQDLPEH